MRIAVRADTYRLEKSGGESFPERSTMGSLNIARFMRRLSATDRARENADETLRDYPLRLRLNIAAERLAPLIYAAWQEVTGLRFPLPWAELDHATKDDWRQRAVEALRPR